MAAFEWIVYAQRMVYVLDYVPTKRAQWELLSQQMTINVLFGGKVSRLA